MSFYKKIIDNLEEAKTFDEMYRFQGAKSYEHFNLKTSKYNEKTIDSYLYVSKSIDHHGYFAIKRIKQLLNKLLSEDRSLIISSSNIREEEKYSKIKHLILNSSKIENLFSIKLVTNNHIGKLLKENCFHQDSKKVNKAIERVDRRVYGGGYGLSGEWKELLCYLTYFTAFHKIDRNELIRLITNMRITGKTNRKDNIDFIIKNTDNYKFKLTPSINNNFTKYDIMNCLEEIIEKGIYIEESELGTNPNKVIKEVVDDYEIGKEKVLTLFDNYYKDR